jgi:acetyl/propionyl-CoA carboxylase alpha subunit/acetyl-CoA carboxylase carboxyltransferase component
MKLLVANRGEIAIRLMRAAAELGIPTVAVYPEDDAGSLHTGKADEAVALSGVGTAAYLDIEQIVAVAKESGCDALHPGYGFLAENAALARRCDEAGVTYIGPSAEMLDLFGDKARARAAATAAGVPIVRGIDHAVSVAQARAFFDALHAEGAGGSMMIKAVAGGGGRGSRMVDAADDVAATFERCRAEAVAAFGNGDLYVEEFVGQARHVEVQILGDDSGAIAHLGERECSVQRHFQKIIEVAPAPALDVGLRDQIIDAAVRLAGSVGYTNAGTFEFLVDGRAGSQQPFAFIEANARLQVEHTVTEQVTGVDIVKTQLRLAMGASLADLGLDQPDVARPRGYAIQARVCMEAIGEDGTIRPSAGTLSAYEAPSGPGVRTDGFGYSGYQTSLLFDSLLAKVIGHSPSANFADAIVRTSRALAEFRIEGIDTNIAFLQSILAHDDFANGEVHTRFVDEQMQQLAGRSAARRFVEPVGGLVLKSVEEADMEVGPVGPDGSVGLVSPMQGTIVEIGVGIGDEVRIGQPVAVVEAMKLQHDIKADQTGVVCAVSMSVGDVVREGYPVVFINAMEVEGGAIVADAGAELDLIRGDLQEVNDRIERNHDGSQQQAVAALHGKGRRSPRENLDDLIDDGSFREFGPPAAGSAAGGTIMGMGTVNADIVGEASARVAVVHSNYVMATYTHGHYRQEQVHELAHDWRVPLVLFSEGEGRPYGDVAGAIGAGVGMDASVFTDFAKLSGLVPLVGVNTGDCFAGNATLLACCDVIIATEDSTIGMTGPSVVEASGQGSYTAADLGAMSIQEANGSVDILVADDAAAVATARKYLSYFQGPVSDWVAPDQRRMRHVIPENRVRTYEMRDIIDTLADEDSVLEIRRGFGIGVITSFIRVEGRPLGVVANNPAHLAGAIDSPGADKAARFFQLCDAFDIPIVVLMDCPGIMVGPDHEREALVRHAVRLFNIGANCSTPMFGVMVRKAYGLGVQAMIGGAAFIPLFTIAWPTAEFAGMNIEGAVKLSARRELAAMEDADERKAAYDRRVADSYETARAINSGAKYVVDPEGTRAWVARGLKSLPPTPPRTVKKRPYVDTW